MAQQTAVEWLVKELKNDSYQIIFGKTFASIETIEQAKAMEKEQIMQSYSDGVFDGAIRDEFYEDTKASGEQYYNETYNK
jgi:predicted Mrr-cat superfamily restriction endonuclease